MPDNWDQYAVQPDKWDKYATTPTVPDPGAQMRNNVQSQAVERMQLDNPYNFTDKSGGGGFVSSAKDALTGTLRGLTHIPTWEDTAPTFGADAMKDIPAQTVQRVTDQASSGNVRGALGTVAGTAAPLIAIPAALGGARALFGGGEAVPRTGSPAPSGGLPNIHPAAKFLIRRIPGGGVLTDAYDAFAKSTNPQSPSIVAPPPVSGSMTQRFNPTQPIIAPPDVQGSSTARFAQPRQLEGWKPAPIRVKGSSTDRFNPDTKPAAPVPPISWHEPEEAGPAPVIPPVKYNPYMKAQNRPGGQAPGRVIPQQTRTIPPVIWHNQSEAEPVPTRIISPPPKPYKARTITKSTQ